MKISIYTCLWNAHCKLSEGHDRGHCWCNLNVRHINFWVSSGVPSLYPFPFFNPVYPLLSFSSFVSFLHSLFCIFVHAFSSPCICHSSSYFLSDSFITAKQSHLRYPCGLHFPCPLHSIHRLLQHILICLLYLLVYPLSSWSCYTFER